MDQSCDHHMIIWYSNNQKSKFRRSPSHIFRHLGTQNTLFSTHCFLVKETFYPLLELETSDTTVVGNQDDQNPFDQQLEISEKGML